MRGGHGSFCWPVCKVSFKEHEDGLRRFNVDCPTFLSLGKKNLNCFSTVKSNLNFKGDSNSSTQVSNTSVLTGLGEDYYICDQSSIKPFVVPEEVACILINWLWWYDWVAELNCGLCRLQVLKRKKNVWNEKVMPLLCNHSDRLFLNCPEWVRQC